MPQSLSQIYLHLIYSTKDRKPLIAEEHMPRLHAYLGGICNQLDSPAIQIGGTEDHVHILCSLSRTITVSKLLEKLKSTSSGWAKDTLGTDSFYWQGGYGAFSVSPTRVGQVQRYIQRQREHHMTMTFQEEFRKFLKEYGLKWDERYVWG